MDVKEDTRARRDLVGLRRTTLNTNQVKKERKEEEPCLDRESNSEANSGDDSSRRSDFFATSSFGSRSFVRSFSDISDIVIVTVFS